MADFILLHGSFHAAWNWHRVLPLLAHAGHHGIAMDLPGHGLDATPARKVTLKACVDAVQRKLESLPGQAVLVAHSRNGIVISQAAERCPEKVAGLVYLAAHLVPNGQSMMDFAVEDVDSLVVQSVLPRLSVKRAKRLNKLFRHPALRSLLPRLLPDRMQTHRLDPAAYREALYADCPDDIPALAHALLEPEPNWPGFTPLALTEARFGRVPRVYIECLQDRAVTLPLQRRMQANIPCARVYSLDCGHSPFFSQPAELTQCLIESLGVFEGINRSAWQEGEAES